LSEHLSLLVVLDYEIQVAGIDDGSLLDVKSALDSSGMWWFSAAIPLGSASLSNSCIALD